VIISFANTTNITIAAGLTYSNTTVGANKVFSFTGGTGNISFS
jgi:hypothetical protein